MGRLLKTESLETPTDQNLPIWLELSAGIVPARCNRGGNLNQTGEHEGIEAVMKRSALDDFHRCARQLGIFGFDLSEDRLNRDDTVFACATGSRCRCLGSPPHLRELAPMRARAGCAPARSARASNVRAGFRSAERSVEKGCRADLPCAASRRGSARLRARRHCAVRGCCPARNRRPELCELRPKTAIRCGCCERQSRRETFRRAAEYLRAVRATRARGG